MNLGFSTVINDKPTYFVQKIWLSLIKNCSDILIENQKINIYSEFEKYSKEYENKSPKSVDWLFSGIETASPKDHTIRNLSPKFKALVTQSVESGVFKIKTETENFVTGTKIHFIINNRTKNRFQFAPIVPVVSRQFLVIKYVDFSPQPIILFFNDNGEVDFTKPCLNLDPCNHFEYTTKLDEIAKSDGFDSWEDFLQYFNTDGTYKMIHWTKKTY